MEANKLREESQFASFSRINVGGSKEDIYTGSAAVLATFSTPA